MVIDWTYGKGGRNGLRGCDPSEQPEVARMALLIYAGTEVEDLHDTLPVPVKPEGITTAQWRVYEKSKLKLKLYFSPKQCNDLPCLN